MRPLTATLVAFSLTAACGDDDTSAPDTSDTSDTTDVADASPDTNDTSPDTSDTPDTTDIADTSPEPGVWAVSLELRTPAGFAEGTYIKTLTTLDVTEITTEGALEIAGIGRLFVHDGALFTGEAAVPALTRHEVSATGELTAGETVNFTGQGATFLSNGVTFIDDTRALINVDAEAKTVLWDPSAMTITEAIDLGVIEREGLEGKAAIGPGVVRDGLVFMPVAWADNVAQKYSETMAVVIVDPTSKDVEAFIEDDRCNFSDGARLGSDGAIYVMGTNYTNLLTLYGVETRNTCLLRIKAGEKVFDPTYHLEFPDVTDGRQAVRFYLLGDQGYAAAQYPEHITTPGASTRELNLKPWRFPLDGASTGTEVSNIPFASAFVSTAHILGDDLYIPANLAADDVSRNAVYKVSAGATSATKVFEVDGLLRGLYRVR